MVYADTPSVTTTLQLTTDRPYGFGGDADVAALPFHVAADTSLFVNDFGRRVGGPAVGAAKVTGANVNVSTFIAYRDPVTNRESAFKVPLLTERIDAATPTELRMLTNSAAGADRTSLLLFNVSATPAWG